MNIFEDIQLEFDNMVAKFETVRGEILRDEILQDRVTKHPFYEIEPFFAEHKNEFLEEESISKMPAATEDFNAAIYDYYTLKVSMETGKLYIRTLHLGEGISDETVFQYNEAHYKSFRIYNHPSGKRPLKLSCLYFKKGLPDVFVQCSPYGCVWKRYIVENNRISGYELKNSNNAYVVHVEYYYNKTGSLDLIKQKYPGCSKVDIIFKRPEKDDNIEDILRKIEDYLVDRIAKNILQNVKLNENVYCILLEYCIQAAFPPVIGIGVESDIKGNIRDKSIEEIYNAPEMQYFTEDETLAIDINEEKIQYAYLFYQRAYENRKFKGESFEYWEDSVKQVYLNVIKRLMKVDFFPSFTKADNFLVLAKDYDAWNVEEFYNEMIEFRNEMNESEISLPSNVVF